MSREDEKAAVAADRVKSFDQKFASTYALQVASGDHPVYGDREADIALWFSDRTEEELHEFCHDALRMLRIASAGLGIRRV